jgi:transposase
VNANQVFKWRRNFERGDLNEPCSALLPVAIAGIREPQDGASIEKHRSAPGCIHIELAGGAMIRIESSPDAALVRQVLESLCK